MRQQRVRTITGFRCSIAIFSACLLVALAAVLPAGAGANDALEARHLVEKSVITLETVSKAPEMEALRDLIKNARGVFVAPQILKGAFIIGAAGGSGVFVARDGKSGKWVGPAFYTIGEASFGLQIGGNASEVILLAMTERGVKAMLESNIKLGGDVGVTAGPVGMGAAASTANLSADIVAFGRSKGLYAGISLDGAIVKTRNKWNSAYYGKTTTATDILKKKNVSNAHAGALLDTVAKLAAK